MSWNWKAYYFSSINVFTCYSTNKSCLQLNFKEILKPFCGHILYKKKMVGYVLRYMRWIYTMVKYIQLISIWISRLKKFCRYFQMNLILLHILLLIFIGGLIEIKEMYINSEIFRKNSHSYSLQRVCLIH